MFELFFRLWRYIKWPVWGEERENELAMLRALQMRGKGKKKHRFKQRPIQKRRIHRTRKK